MINHAEINTQQGLDNRSQIDHKLITNDHKLITKNNVINPVNASNQYQEADAAIDHKKMITKPKEGGGGVASSEINCEADLAIEALKKVISSPTAATPHWQPGDKFRSTSQHKSYKKYLGKVLVVRQDNPTRLTVSAEGTRDEFCYHSIERVLDTP